MSTLRLCLRIGGKPFERNVSNASRATSKYDTQVHLRYTQSDLKMARPASFEKLSSPPTPTNAHCSSVSRSWSPSQVAAVWRSREKSISIVDAAQITYFPRATGHFGLGTLAPPHPTSLGRRVASSSIWRPDRSVFENCCGCYGLQLDPTAVCRRPGFLILSTSEVMQIG